jgi:hypothetical protein
LKETVRREKLLELQAEGEGSEEYILVDPIQQDSTNSLQITDITQLDDDDEEEPNMDFKSGF